MIFDVQKLLDEVEQDSFLKMLNNIGCDKEDVEMLENLINCFRKRGVCTHTIISALTEFTLNFIMKEGETDDG